MIKKQADEDNPFNDDFDGIRITTVGRISHEKGPDIAAKACKILVERGYNVKWHWVGAHENTDIQKLIDENDLSGKFIPEGLQTNPYKYIANSDVYVQPSRFEGKSIAIEEAKVLGVPVAVTGFTTAASQIENGVTGIIADEISAEALAEAVEELISNRELYEKIKTNLKKETGNTDEIKKLYALIEGKG